MALYKVDIEELVHYTVLIEAVDEDKARDRAFSQDEAPNRQNFSVDQRAIVGCKTILEGES